MKLDSKRLIAVAAAGMVATGALAGQIFSAKETGSGRLNGGGLDYVSATLNSNHTFVIKAYGHLNATEQGFSGTWSSNDSHSYSLKVTGYNSQSATGTGGLRITPSMRDFSHVSLSGSGNAGSFSLTFDSSVAQRLTGRLSVNSTEGGTGAITIGSSRKDLRQGYVRLEPGGDMQVRLGGDTDIQLLGTWALDSARNDTVTLHITHGTGNASGTGSLQLRSDRRGFSNLSASGMTGSRSFSTSFNAFNGGYTSGQLSNAKVAFRDMGKRRAGAEVDSARPGNGTFTTGSDSLNMTEARVILMQNGTAEVIVRGDTERALKGTWTNQTSNQVVVTITGGYHNAKGSGNVVLNSTRTMFTTIDINGTVDGSTFSVSFTANH